MTQPYYYILDADGQPAPIDDCIAWAEWVGANHDRSVVEQTTMAGPDGSIIQVSTVFLGLDHSHGGPLPLLYETMIFGGQHDQMMWRYSTPEQATAGHADIVAALTAGHDLGDMYHPGGAS